MTKLTALFLTSLITLVLSSEPIPFTINTKKWSHVLDDHFISITVNPTDLLQGKVYGLAMNSTMAILKGLAPAYVRIGSADTGKYTFKRNRYPSDVVKPDDEYTVTETHWMVFNEVAKQAGLDVIVCLNAAHRSEGTTKWDTRNSLELISFSDSQGYNLTWQLGYEVQGGEGLSGLQYGKDLNRLRTILNAFPRYQHAKLIGPDIRVIHKKEEVDFWNDVLVEAGPTLDAVTWHPRWPQPSKMKVSDNSDLGYEFPIDYLEWDRAQLSKILQKSIFKNPVWIGETKTESTGTFAEGLIWARRLVLAAKSGIEVVMKQPNLMDVTHPKPEYWIALLHKRLLGKSVLETRSVGNNTDLTVISHCTNPFYWSDKPEKLQDGAVTVYGVNMGGVEQKIQIKGTWSGKSQLLFQYVLTSGSDPDSVFSQMTYLNGEPLMMTDDGMLPDIIPKIKKLERGLYMKLPPYSVGFWVIPEAKVKICQLQQHNMPAVNIETPNAAKSTPKTLENIRDINQFLVEKLKNPESESEEVPEMKIEEQSSEEKDVSLPTKENALPRVARRIRQVSAMDELNQELKAIMRETQEFLSAPEGVKGPKLGLPKVSQTMEQRIQGLAEGISDAIKFTNQEQEFNKFLEDAGLKQNFGSLIQNERRFKPLGGREFQPYLNSQNPEGLLDEFEVKDRLRRSISESDDISPEQSMEEEEEESQAMKFGKKITLKDDEEIENEKQDLVIPHQADLKGLEEKYKQIVQIKLKDGKRKIDDIKRKIKQQDETAKASEIQKKPAETVTDIQEEIIKKEIELLEKTEETVADILKSQKKRQETFEDIIFDELNDVKGERIRELKEMQKNQRKSENSIVKRQAQVPLTRPLLKTVEYIEKNLNLEPESVKKIKRSLEERMGEILRNYDTKKSLEMKRQRSLPAKEERKAVTRKTVKETERKSEPIDSKMRSERRDGKDEGRMMKERPKEKNIIKKTQSSQTSKKKPTEEPMLRNRKSEESKRKYIEDDDDSFELFNEKKFEETVKKPSRRRVETAEEKKLLRRSKPIRKEEDEESLETEKEEMSEERLEKVKPKKKLEEPRSESSMEEVPLKNDKERRKHMLEQITIMVDRMNSKESGSDRMRRMNDVEDISDEFESERRPRKIKRKPRKADLSEVLEKDGEKGMEEMSETESGVKPKLSKLKKLRVRANRKQKEMKKPEMEDGEEVPQRKRHLTPLLELEKKKLLKPKLRKINPKFHMHGNELLTDDKFMKEEHPMPTATTESHSFTPIQTEELKKDLEEIMEEKVFLGRSTESSKEKSETNGKELLKATEATPQETVTPTEGFIIVEPTEETGSGEVLATEKPELDETDTAQWKTEDKVNEKSHWKSENIKEDEKPQWKSEEDKQNKKEQWKTEDKESKESQLKSDDRNEKPVWKFDDSKESEKSHWKAENIKETEKPQWKSEEDKENKKEEWKSEDKVLSEKPEWKSEEKEESENKKWTSEEKEEIEKKQWKSEESEDKQKSEEKNKKQWESDDKLMNEKPQWKTEDKEDNEKEKWNTDEKNETEKTKWKSDSSEKQEKSEEKDTEKPETTPEIKKNHVLLTIPNGEGKESHSEDSLEDMLRSLDASLEDRRSEESIEDMSKSSSREESQETPSEPNQRKRRATFQPRREEKDDYSSEERIRRFKQMVYRKSPTKKPLKNEVRATSSTSSSSSRSSSSSSNSMGMGADEFLKMAGSTVRVMFDDVIPEAYGQTKNKIQNMGITEYIKEFGKIVQQMKNLDQIFLNIGEAAVKGYIRGNKAEKGPYIQVISRKKREVPEETTTAELLATTDMTLTKTPEEATEGSSGTRNTEEESTVGRIVHWENNWDSRTSGRELGESVREDDTTGVLETPEVNPSEKTPTKETTPEVGEPIKKDRKTDLQQRIFSPWIKTTKDFIQQALTTLKRQRELSEILANDLMNREVKKRAIGKREVGEEEEEEEEEEPKLPVYYMVPPKGNKKRETQEGKSDEGLVRRLRGLQPGVYVVPTEEMTNIRSEQITNEAKQKSGMPNVVTLNIYYDKKNGEKSETDGKVSEDPVTYYHKAWNDVVGQYGQNNQYLTVPGVMSSPGVSTPALQTETVYTGEPRIAQLPSSRLIQYPPPTYHYPPVQKMFPPVVPNPQPVYGPVYYLPQENRFLQSPGTKRQWREFKARSSLPSMSTGWNIQYETPAKNSGKPVVPSYNKNYKFLVQDKKRSVGDFKADPSWSETALPFWKFFTASEKKNKKIESEKKDVSAESGSSEDVFEENRKRAKAAAENKVKEESMEVKEEKIPEEEVEEDKSRKRRSIGNRLNKRSNSYLVEFRDHDVLPDWFGTYQELDNALENFAPQSRRSHIISTPWSEEDDEILSLLEADDELSLLDMDNNDYYYLNDNAVQPSRRYPRSTDQFESNLIKSNMIYKMPMDGVHLKPKDLGMAGVKKLTDEDSSLEFGTKSNPVGMKTTVSTEWKKLELKGPSTEAPTSLEMNQTQPSQNGTSLLPRNPHDDTFYYFFKYAYDSLVKVMKSMTEFF